MTKLSKVLNTVWLIVLIAAIISQLYKGILIIDVICAILSTLLSIFYFYGSAFYFLNLKFKSFKKDLTHYRTFIKLFGSLLGLPFAITAISVGFLLFQFPGVQLIFLIGVVPFIVCFIISRYNLSKNPDEKIWSFIQSELNWLALYNLLVIVLIILTWEINPLNFNWSDVPSNAPRY